LITITSNRAQWVKRANDSASVFRRRDVIAEVRRGLTREIHQMNRRQIEGGGIGKSGSFAPLALKTIKSKGHSRFLVNTGKLLSKATRGGSIRAGRAFGVFVYSFTINHPAINFLQFGTKNMPARPVVDPTEEQTRELSRVIDKAALRRAWKRIGWFDKLGTARMTGFDKIDVKGQ